MKYLPKDLEGLQKYRIGDWRILFWVDHKKKENRTLRSRTSKINL